MALYALTNGTSTFSFEVMTVPSGFVGSLGYVTTLIPAGRSVVTHVSYPLNAALVGQIWPRYKETP